MNHNNLTRFISLFYYVALLFGQGIQLITRLRKNMKNKLMPIFDKLISRKRAIIETIDDQLKNISQIDHNRNRSPVNFLVNESKVV